MDVNQLQTVKPEITAKGIALALFFWVLYTLLSAVLLSLSNDVPFPGAVIGMGLSSLIMVVLMIPAWILIVRELHYTRGWIKLFAHLAAGIIYTFAWYYLYLFMFDLLFGRELLGPGFTQNSGWIMFSTFTIYVITFSVIHAIESRKELQLKEKQAKELKKLSRKQEIAVLKAQLNPHFLFNTLNSINAAVTSDPQETRSMIAKLSEMLRYSLDSSEKEYVTLAEELQFVKRYLDLEQRRLGNRLNVQYQVDETVLDLRIPPMILQPLAENAVKHGIAPLAEGGTIVVRIKPKKDSVYFMIKDTGQGMPADHAEKRKGIGLHNINEMLKKRFGEAYSLDVSPNQPNGTTVSFSIPVE